jgi:hypothetical protein
VLAKSNRPRRRRAKVYPNAASHPIIKKNFRKLWIEYCELYQRFSHPNVRRRLALLWGDKIILRGAVALWQNEENTACEIELWDGSKLHFQMKVSDPALID